MHKQKQKLSYAHLSTIKICGGVKAPNILNLGTKYVWSTSCPGHFTSRDGSWVGLRAGFNLMVERKSPYPLELNPMRNNKLPLFYALRRSKIYDVSEFVVFWVVVH
jgi:hypothetical protein